MKLTPNTDRFLPLATLLIVMFVGARIDVQAKGWFLSGDTSICASCGSENVIIARMNSLLNVNFPDPAFVGAVGGGLAVLEESRFDFQPHITALPAGVSTAKSSALFSTGVPQDLAISGNRNSDQMRFTDGRLPAAVVAMPEPATMLLLGSGLAGVLAAGWKRRRAGSETE